ncbi:LppA family lipoprotein [Saccharopolyspora sp. WRP15-2]|uniref:LppA family lipoprotein n=1 Tax=Saccharopolyspora oryzae TaxID=2997343 RepID=A0ABT4UZK3_9PSEU|nr:LppA family lipoprotein [Saccharopolyspora oryzae]MDA3626492.1 LppA family lipoprotein [Saccharopolyspora oryzae]
MTSSFEGDESAQREELMRRPSIEEVTARYQEMLGRVRDALASEFPWIQWMQSDEIGRAGCAQFPAFRSDGETRTLGIWTANGNLPDAQWPRAQQLTEAVAREYGFGPVRAIVDRPSDHEVVSFDQYGANIKIGTAKNTVLSGGTDCHLPQAVKERIASTGQ